MVHYGFNPKLGKYDTVVLQSSAHPVPCALDRVRTRPAKRQFAT